MRRTVMLDIITFLLAVLFLYASLTKLMDFEKFTVQIGQSPLLTGFGKVIAPAVIATELLTAAFLFISPYRILALFASFSLMTMFTAYIVAILTFSPFIPCSCGGILERMGWTQHLIFNIAFMLFAIIGIYLEAYQSKGSNKC
ncbi:MAG: hypothetical protein QM762_26190 [Chryseolinea sp.]